KSTARCKQVEDIEQKQERSVETLKPLVEQTRQVAQAGKCELKELANALFPLLETMIGHLSSDAFSIEAKLLASVLTEYAVAPICRLLNSNWAALFSQSAADVELSSETCRREKARIDALRQEPAQPSDEEFKQNVKVRKRHCVCKF